MAEFNASILNTNLPLAYQAGPSFNEQMQSNINLQNMLDQRRMAQQQLAMNQLSMQRAAQARQIMAQSVVPEQPAVPAQPATTIDQVNPMDWTQTKAGAPVVEAQPAKPTIPAHFDTMNAIAALYANGNVEEAQKLHEAYSKQQLEAAQQAEALGKAEWYGAKGKSLVDIYGNKLDTHMANAAVGTYNNILRNIQERNFEGANFIRDQHIEELKRAYPDNPEHWKIPEIDPNDPDSSVKMFTNLRDQAMSYSMPVAEQTKLGQGQQSIDIKKQLADAETKYKEDLINLGKLKLNKKPADYSANGITTSQSLAQQIVNGELPFDEALKIYPARMGAGVNKREQLVADVKKIDPSFDYAKSMRDYKVWQNRLSSTALQAIETFVPNIDRFQESMQALATSGGLSGSQTLNDLIQKGQVEFGGEKIQSESL